MSALAHTLLRRGACPGLSAPMATGDGLLVRFSPIGTIPLDALGAVCDAAERYGNGIVEITARGNIQVRGLNDTTAPEFARVMETLNIAAENGVPVVCNPLAGLDPEELLDTGRIAAELRGALAQTSLASRLGPKVSVAIDGGGNVPLDTLTADIRMRAFKMDGAVLVAIEMADTEIGAVRAGDAVAAVTRLLEAVARHGRQARARDIVATENVTLFQTAIAKFLIPAGCREAAGRQTFTGTCLLRDGSVACAVALPFGYADAASLRRLAAAAKAGDARGFRAAPDRTLFAVGLAAQAADTFTAAVRNLGFIVDAGDPRRHVIACAGAPICGAAHIAAREIGPQIAAAAGRYLDADFEIHVSGCAKGCAHSAPAALSIVGTERGCALVANGSARDTPFMTVPTTDLIGKITDVACKLKDRAHHV